MTARYSVGYKEELVLYSKGTVKVLLILKANTKYGKDLNNLKEILKDKVALDNIGVDLMLYKGDI
jgi:hypothetical protein